MIKSLSLPQQKTWHGMTPQERAFVRSVPPGIVIGLLGMFFLAPLSFFLVSTLSISVGFSQFLKEEISTASYHLELYRSIKADEDKTLFAVTAFLGSACIVTFLVIIVMFFYS